MSEATRIAEQMDLTFSGDAWHGPSVKALLEGIDAESAAAHPISGAHSIGELVGHIAFWQDVVRRRLAGETVVGSAVGDVDGVAERDNFPQPSGRDAWAAAVRRLDETHRSLRDAVARLSDARLSEGVVGKEYTAYVMLHGIIQHDLYHAGQIVMLKKALGR
jgi:uncharacterized damage-inducible protein DinB